MREHDYRDFNPSAFSGCAKAVGRYQKKYLRYFERGSKIVDVGCGEGVFLELLETSGFEGLGIDSSEAMVSRAREKGLEVEHADLGDALKNKEAEYGGVFCAHVIEHLPPRKALEFISDAVRALRSGGTLVVVTPNFRDIDVMSEKFWLDITHVRPYPLRLLREMFEYFDLAVIAAGVDRDSARPGRQDVLKYLWNKLRFGGWYGTGDHFIVGRKGVESPGN